jgi:diadenosine tetraphosphate (Ap4A) HIT family hydrolase
MHVHVHVLPRRQDDNLLINWSPFQEGDRARIVELAGFIRAQL